MSGKARKWQAPGPHAAPAETLADVASQAFGHVDIVRFSPLTLMLAGALIQAGHYSNALEHVGIDLGRYPEPETP